MNDYISVLQYGLKMELTLGSNPLYAEEQKLKINKYTALIGENGSGKSSILQSIFEGKMAGTLLLDWKVVCFSSGHNERYSKEFTKYLKQARKSKHGLSLNCFFYDKSWSPLLIFLASILKKEGKVRELLRSLDLVSESDDLGDDISTSLTSSFRIDKQFLSKVAQALKQEESGEIETLRSTPYFRSLSSFIENTVDREYDFENTISKRNITITSENIFSTSFESPIDESQEKIIEHPSVTFLTQAIDADNPITKDSLRLVFNNEITLNDISDGEYQLLFIYSLLDLFDSEKTLFLLDEADSHLHYRNISKLWSAISDAEGKSLITTHLLDSISEIGVEHINVVKKGSVLPYTERKELQARLEELSNIKKAKLKTYSLHERIVLMDNENDWEIFSRLVKKKLRDINGVERKLNKFCCISVPSGWDMHTSKFANSKMKWLESFFSYIDGSSPKTDNIYLICDRDNLPLDSIDNETLELKGGKDFIKSSINKSALKASLMVWRRREVKHYLLSFSALKHHGLLEKINNDLLGLASHLHKNMTGDEQCLVNNLGQKIPILTRHIPEETDYNNGLALLSSEKVKNILGPLIENSDGMSIELLEKYIDLIPAEEISADIISMYEYITKGL